MAHRRRGRAGTNPTVGLRRLDAALDAMRPYEFPEQLVRETIDQLLEVYGGKEGWPFIEEASYSVLLEVILEKQNNSAEEEKKEDLLQGNATKEGIPETSSNATTFTTTTTISEASSSNRVPQDALLPTSDGLNTNDVQDSASLGAQDSTMGAEIGGHVLTPVDNAIESCENPPMSKRKSCHGWIGDDDDHEHDLIHLPSAPLPKELKMLLNQIKSSSKAAIHKDGKRRRKSRWDENPEGMQMEFF
ncbi:hypothetical protein L6164_030052 [Bauhinia variegata]|uniref:Uncharacterized protein n=1 Tax=Bauhinia variegata TaxID=167791 RepID=A0ACB9LAM0_BAUVA|nr:hypothetical protein L6164_030052 [Bauhinia variegata]